MDGSTWDRLELEFVQFEYLSRPHRRPFPTTYGTTAFRQDMLLNIWANWLTLFSHQELGTPSRQTHARSAFRQLREQSHQDRLAGACATYPLRSHELRNWVNN